MKTIKMIIYIYGNQSEMNITFFKNISCLNLNINLIILDEDNDKDTIKSIYQFYTYLDINFD